MWVSTGHCSFSFLFELPFRRASFLFLRAEFLCGRRSLLCYHLFFFFGSAFLLRDWFFLNSVSGTDQSFESVQFFQTIPPGIPTAILSFKSFFFYPMIQVKVPKAWKGFCFGMVNRILDSSIT